MILPPTDHGLVAVCSTPVINPLDEFLARNTNVMADLANRDRLSTRSLVTQLFFTFSSWAVSSTVMYLSVFIGEIL